MTMVLNLAIGISVGIIGYFYLKKRQIVGIAPGTCLTLTLTLKSFPSGKIPMLDFMQLQKILNSRYSISY
jgi:hypothetical protein